VDHEQRAGAAVEEELRVDSGRVEGVHRAGGQAGCPDADDEATRLQPGIVTAGHVAASLLGVRVLGPGDVREDDRQLLVDVEVVAEDRDQRGAGGCCRPCARRVGPGPRGGEQHAQRLGVEGGRAVLDEVVDGAELLVADRLVGEGVGGAGRAEQQVGGVLRQRERGGWEVHGGQGGLRGASGSSSTRRRLRTQPPREEA